MSKTKECPSCAMEVDQGEAICPICQYEFPSQPKVYTWIAILLIIALMILFII